MDSPSNDQGQSPPSHATGRNAPRSTRGCWTCRAKKVKCDEQRPRCRRCARLRLLCDYAPRARKKHTKGPQGPSSSKPWDLDALAFPPLRLPELGSSSASSVTLSAADHEAIRYYRTTFGRVHHTKNHEYSLYAVLFTVAAREPMVMRVVLALGAQELAHRKQLLDLGSDGDEGDAACPSESATSLRHYSAALRLMAEAIGSRGDAVPDVDAICAALYLMLVYEQKHGDARCLGLANHLAGAALVVKHHLYDMLCQMRVGTPPAAGDPSLSRPMRSGERQLSMFAARVLVYLAYHDAAATSFGLGGQLNDLLNDVFDLYRPNGPFCDGAFVLDRASLPLYRSTWRDYPQSELLEELESLEQFALLSSTAQLRYMISQLGRLDGEAARELADKVDARIGAVSHQFRDLLAVADSLDMSLSSSRRVVKNIRTIVPHFFAIRIERCRVIRKLGIADDETSCSPSTPRHVMRRILDLALQTIKFEGHEALVRIAFPLYVVALETEDEEDRRWLLDRFRDLSCLGKNIQRAHRLLARAVASQGFEARIEAARYLQPGELDLFVL